MEAEEDAGISGMGSVDHTLSKRTRKKRYKQGRNEKIEVSVAADGKIIQPPKNFANFHLNKEATEAASCIECISHGYGWSVDKRTCGNYENKECIGDETDERREEIEQLQYLQKNANSQIQRAFQYFQQRRLKEGLHLLDESLFAIPKVAGPDIWAARGLVLCQLGYTLDGLRSFDEALRIKPDVRDPDLFSNRGAAFVSLGKHQEAIMNFERAISINPKHVRAKNFRAVALQEVGRYKESLSSFQELLKINTQLAGPGELNFSIGAVLQKLSRYSEAVEHFREGLKHNKKNADAWSNFGLALVLTGEVAEGKRAFNSALKLEPNHVGALGNRAKRRFLDNDYEASAADWKRMIDARPSSDAYEGAGRALQKLGRQDEANEMCSKAVEIILRHSGGKALGLSEESINTFNEAIKSGNAETVRKKLTENPHLALVRTEDGKGPFFTAREFGFRAIAGMLKKAGANEVARDRECNSPKGEKQFIY
eukprot:g5194.t1